ncbi:phosphopyruvate hydratase [Candidatus Babeliales bacterium]|nr:phosphopyruvate hydratase [Candidatus Babeliales bacterium]
MKIKSLMGRQIFDSRGFPTLECLLEMEDGFVVQSSVPAGASVGHYEALELRDGDKKVFNGTGVLKAIYTLETIIAPALCQKAPDLIAMDELLIELDGTPNKAYLGANTTLAASIAVARAQAYVQGLYDYALLAELFQQKPTLPRCMVNILNGGMHADNGLVFQEFMIMPSQQVGMNETMSIIFDVYQTLKHLLHDAGHITNVGDEGGFAPQLVPKGLKKQYAALDFLVQAIERAGFTVEDVSICLDAAANYFYDAKTKRYVIEGDFLTSADLVSFYEELIKRYPIFSIEDGMSEDDWEGWQLLTEKLGDKIHLIGDDIFVTSTEKLMRGVEEGVANGVLIKPNQRGTISEAYAALALGSNAEYLTIASHRSGETNDPFIADFAVGCAAGYLKVGACVRGERVAKYNRLLAIEKTL